MISSCRSVLYVKITAVKTQNRENDVSINATATLDARELHNVQ